MGWETKLNHFWREDAERINRLSEQAAAMGLHKPSAMGPPPALNPDGSLAEPDEDDDLDDENDIDEEVDLGGEGG